MLRPPLSCSGAPHRFQLLHRGFPPCLQKASGESERLQHPESRRGLWLGCCHVSVVQRGRAKRKADDPLGEQALVLYLTHNQHSTQTRVGRVSLLSFGRHATWRKLTIRLYALSPMLDLQPPNNAVLGLNVLSWQKSLVALLSKTREIRTKKNGRQRWQCHLSWL